MLCVCCVCVCACIHACVHVCVRGELDTIGDVLLLSGLRSRLKRIAQEVAARRTGYSKRKPPPVRMIVSVL